MTASNVLCRSLTGALVLRSLIGMSDVVPCKQTDTLPFNDALDQDNLVRHG